MFTGIITTCGIVKSVRHHDSISHLDVQAEIDLSDVYLGNSIAIDGVCLTVTAIKDKSPAILSFDVGQETLAKTTMGQVQIGQKIHLEKAMRLSDRLDGHLVLGHVDGLGIVRHRKMESESLILKVSCPESVLETCVVKGSISLDGVSLTINEVEKDLIHICLIPHTLQHTNFMDYQVGRMVNLESDILGKYVFRFVNRNDKNSQISSEFLAKNGFGNLNGNGGYL